MPPRFVKVSESLTVRTGVSRRVGHNLGDACFRDAGEIENVARRNRSGRRKVRDGDGSPRELFPLHRLGECVRNRAVSEHAGGHRCIRVQRVGRPFGKSGEVEQKRAFQRDFGHILCVRSGCPTEQQQENATQGTTSEGGLSHARDKPVIGVSTGFLSQTPAVGGTAVSPY